MRRCGLLLIGLAIAAGCGDDDTDDQSDRIAGTPDPTHAQNVE